MGGGRSVGTPPTAHAPSACSARRSRPRRRSAKAIDEAERGVRPIDQRTTLAEFLAEWVAATEASVKPRTWESYELHVRRHIEPRLGHLRLVQIDARAVQRFVDALARDGLAPKTVRSVHGTLSLVLGMAARYGLAGTAEGVRLPRVRRAELTIPTPLEVERLAEEIDPRFWAVVILCGYTAIRQGEALALRPVDVDWLRRRVHVGGTLNLRTREREETKSTAGARWVTLPSRVADALSQHVAEYQPREWLFERPSDGGPWKASRLDEAWRYARQACRLDHVRFHDLRHAAISMWIAAGWTVKRVQQEAGHADPAMTLRVYSHLWPDPHEEGRARLDALIGESLAVEAGPHADPRPAVPQLDRMVDA
jgi:integrase